jgi:2-methylcitrate dehydratase PrpD
VTALASALAQSKESSIIGGERLSLAGATVLNGFLVTAVTMCDVFRPTAMHVTPEVVPPALAIAERDSLPGRDLLTALIVGFETAARIGLGLDYDTFRARGFHAPGVIGPFAAAAAVGRLRGFDPETMAASFGLAGSQAAGTYAAWGTPTVKFHQCRGALSGLMAALLAEQRFVATRGFLTAPDGGLFSSYSGGGHPDRVVEGLGERWEMEEIALRLWPSAARIQGLITAMFEIMQKYGLAPDGVRKLDVSVSEEVFGLHGGFSRYKGKFEALLSAHYTAAVILHDRELSLRQFEPARYNDPPLVRFAAERVNVRPDPALQGPQSRVDAERMDGSVVSVRCDSPKGSPDNPLSTAEIADKFRIYGRDRLSDSRIEAALGAVSRLEELGSVRELMDLLRTDK